MVARALLIRLGRALRRKPRSGSVLKPGETLARFVWRISGRHQVYVGLLAVAVAALSFAPVELHRRLIDGAIVARDMTTLVELSVVLLAVVLAQAVLKYALMVYQSWVSEAAIKSAREELAAIAVSRGAGQGDPRTGAQAVAVLGSEIDQVGSFVGTSISEAVVNVTFIVVTASYLVFLQPVVGVLCLALLAPQVLLAPYLQPKLDRLVERQIKLVRNLGDAVAEAEPGDAGSGRPAATIRSLFVNRMTYHALKFGLKGLLNLFGALAPLVAIVVGGMFVIGGDITIGALVALVSGLDRLATPLRDLLNFYRDLAQTRVHHGMVLEWLEAVEGGAGTGRASAA